MEKSILFTDRDKRVIDILYRDFKAIERMFIDKANLLEEFDSVWLSDIKNKDETDKLFNIHLSQRLLLEFMFMYGNIILIRVCKIIRDKIVPKEKRRIGFKGFLKDYGNYLKISSELKRRLYCFVVYRNKIIEHHEFEKIKAFFPGENFKIFPLGITNKDEKIEKSLELLFKKYISLHNVDKLFYGIPIENKNDREIIDNIVEKIGCVSYSFLEIRQMFDSFFKEIKTEIPNDGGKLNKF